MKSVEEIKAEIINNAYTVELSNGQTLFVDRVSSEKKVFVYLKNEKSVYGFDTVLGISKRFLENAEEVKCCVEDTAKGLNDVLLTDYKSVEEYRAACADLTNEVVSAIIDEPASPEEVVSEKEVIEHRAELVAKREVFANAMTAMKAVKILIDCEDKDYLPDYVDNAIDKLEQAVFDLENCITRIDLLNE